MKYTYLIIIIILLSCLFPMPYGYYTLARFVFMTYFAYIAHDMYRKQKERLMVTFIGLSILFQPFCKIVLGRVLWNVVDVVVAAFLLFVLYKENYSKNNKI